MLPSTRRPSATTYGRVAKLSSSSTILATARVAPLPEPIATPRSARVSASTSLAPSAVMATGLERGHELLLLPRRAPPEHRVARERAAERGQAGLGLPVRQGARVDGM